MAVTAPPEFEVLDPAVELEVAPAESWRDFAVSVGGLAVEALRHAHHLPGVAWEIARDQSDESSEFRQAMSRRYDALGSDRVNRWAWIVPAKDASEGTFNLVLLHGFAVQHRYGLGREMLREFHEHIPNANIVAIGSEGIESDIPSKAWNKAANFEDMARGRLELMAKLDLLHPEFGLDRYTIVGQSMGTIIGAYMAVEAAKHHQRVEQLIEESPAGLQEAGYYNYFKRFVVPETIDLINRIRTTPVDKLGHFLRTLVGTARINPKARGAMRRQGELITASPAPMSAIANKLPADMPIQILAGDRDFVANPQACREAVTAIHLRTNLHVVRGEHHMSLTRAQKMAARTARILSTPVATDGNVFYWRDDHHLASVA